jgi:hypothetical protein
MALSHFSGCSQPPLFHRPLADCSIFSLRQNLTNREKEIADLRARLMICG